jgi:hypothetical protein
MRRSNRADRKVREVARIVGSLRSLPNFFVNGLYNLLRAGLPNAEIILACQRCRAWTAKAKRSGYGECECCGTRLAVDAVNAQGVSIWNLDHCRHTNTFRGILHERCNREIGDGNRERKRAHVGYIEAHESRLRIEHEKFDRDEFLSAGALPD